MEVFVEKKVMEDYMIAHQPGFAQIRDELCTFEEGLLFSYFIIAFPF